MPGRTSCTPSRSTSQATTTPSTTSARARSATSTARHSGEIYPELADNARRTWGLENNIYNLGHRGYVAKPGGESDCGLTYIKDLAAGRYHLPWEDEIQIKDGSIYGYPTTGGRFGND